MGKGRHRSYPKKEEKEEHETIQTLKAANRRLKSENEKLKSEIATLEEAFTKTTKYLKDSTDNIPISKIIKGIKKDKTLKQIKELGACKKCGSLELKELDAGKAGSIKICMTCNDRIVIKYGEEREN